MGRRGGSMTPMATIKEGAAEDTAIKLFLRNASESSGEIIQCAHFSRATS